MDEAKVRINPEQLINQIPDGFSKDERTLLEQIIKLTTDDLSEEDNLLLEEKINKLNEMTSSQYSLECKINTITDKAPTIRRYAAAWSVSDDPYMKDRHFQSALELRRAEDPARRKPPQRASFAKVLGRRIRQES